MKSSYTTNRLIFLSNTLIRSFGLSLGDRVFVEGISSKYVRQNQGKLTIFAQDIGKVSKLCINRLQASFTNIEQDIVLHAENVQIS